MEEKYELVINPDLDYFVGIMGGPEIPTKQDKFKPLQYHKVIGYDEDENETQIEGELYIMNHKMKTSQKAFEEYFTSCIIQNLRSEHPYTKDQKLEVIISIKMNEKRLANVDIDNLIKIVLDCLKGNVLVDDTQVINVLASKYIIYDKDLEQPNGIQVGIRLLEKKDSYLAGLQLFELNKIE